MTTDPTAHLAGITVDIHDLVAKRDALDALYRAFEAALAASGEFEDFSDDDDTERWFDFYKDELTAASQGTWSEWRFDHVTTGAMLDYLTPLELALRVDDGMEPARRAVAEALSGEIQLYRICCSFFDELGEVVDRGFDMASDALAGTRADFLGSAIGALADQVEGSGAFDGSLLLDLVGDGLALLSLGVAEELMETLAAVGSTIRHLVQVGEKVARAGADDPLGNISATFQQLAAALERLQNYVLRGAEGIQRHVLSDWGRLEAVASGLLKGRVTTTHTQELADDLYVFLSLGVWRVLLWQVYECRMADVGTTTYSVSGGFGPTTFESARTFTGSFSAGDDAALADGVGRVYDQDGVVYVWTYRTTDGKAHHATLRVVSRVDGKPMDTLTWSKLHQQYGLLPSDFVLPDGPAPGDTAPAAPFGPGGAYLDPHSLVVFLHHEQGAIGYPVDGDCRTVQKNLSGTSPQGRPWSAIKIGYSSSDGRFPTAISLASIGAPLPQYSSKAVPTPVWAATEPVWGVGLGRLDAAYSNSESDIKPDNLYFFGGNSFVKEKDGERRPPTPIDASKDGNFPGLWTEGLCAACVNGHDKAFVFRDFPDGLRVMQYDIASSRTDVGVYGPDGAATSYLAAETFPDLVFGVLDRSRPLQAAVHMLGVIYFFSGDCYQACRAPARLGIASPILDDVRTPRKIGKNFTGLPAPFDSGNFDAAWTHHERLYICKGAQYVRFGKYTEAVVGSGGMVNLAVSTDRPYPATMAASPDHSNWDGILRFPPRPF